MKIKKSLLSVCLSISLMFGCLVPSISVYAVGDSWTSAQSYTYFQNNFDDINTRLNGVIINQNRLEESFEDFLEEYRDNYNIPSGTSTQTWIGDNITGSYQNGSSGDADLTFSQTFRQAMRDWCSAYIEANTGYKYVYSTQTASYVNSFNDQDNYHAFLDFISSYENTGSICYIPDGYIGSLIYVVTPPEGKKIDFVYYSGPSYGAYSSQCYSNWELDCTITRYDYNSNSKTYVQNGSTSSFSGQLIKLKTNSAQITYGSCPISLNTTQYIMYMNVDAMRNAQEGVRDYYTVQDSYNSTIEGSYNTTTNNISNTLTNSDVSNYINNYYVQNGNYPTPNDINIYITNNINGGGNNNGGGGDDNGGSNPDWDFGFLSTIGQFIASLIAGIGEVIGGVLEALTSIITSLREGFPNVIGSLLEYFMPFLPDEVVTLISLSIVFAILVGIIKLIRG